MPVQSVTNSQAATQCAAITPDADLNAKPLQKLKAVNALRNPELGWDSCGLFRTKLVY